MLCTNLNLQQHYHIPRDLIISCGGSTEGMVVVDGRLGVRLSAEILELKEHVVNEKELVPQEPS